jgi:hypothetical protein
MTQFDNKGIDARRASTIASALSLALSGNHEKVAELLLANGGKMIVHEGDEEQASAYAQNLHSAMYRGDGKVVELLLEKGTDLDTKGACYHKIRKAVSRWRKSAKEYIDKWEFVDDMAQAKWDMEMKGILDLLLEEGRRLNAMQLDGS